MSQDGVKRGSVKRWWISAVVVFALGMALALVGVQRDQNLIADLVRSPSGCESTVNISVAGRYYIYVETKGTIGDIGPCNSAVRTYEFDSAPQVAVTLGTSSGEAVDLRPNDSVEYDAPEFAGRSIVTFVISEPGNFVVNMESAQTDAVIAIGRNASMMDGTLLVSGASLVMVAFALLIVAIIATRSNRRAQRTDVTSTRSEVFVTYDNPGHRTASQETTDRWAPPRPEDRAGQ
jgi:hypothetical protein